MIIYYLLILLTDRNTHNTYSLQSLNPVHFFNKKEEQLSLEWFNKRINHYAKIIGIQKIKKYYADGRTLKLVTCMALREAGERHHDNAGGSRKLSAVAAGHTMEVKERHYEKVEEDFEQVHESYRKFHPALVENW